MIVAELISYPKVDGKAIFININAVQAVVEIENHIKVFVCNEWIELAVTLDEFAKRTQRE